MIWNFIATLPPGYTPCTLPKPSFFGIPAWYKYLQGTYDPKNTVCNVFFDPKTDIWKVALAVVDMLLYVGGLVAVISIIIAGFEYVSSIGNPEKITSARKRIQNSLIGLGICLIAITVVNFIGYKL